mmetsp:Transcript_12310/g.16198  ORF Transcript_12310/g.16198 Transcript_12310/m.16198 type:complete len:315 (+) Transcript_12310:87-1031(+)
MTTKLHGKRNNHHSSHHRRNEYYDEGSMDDDLPPDFTGLVIECRPEDSEELHQQSHSKCYGNSSNNNKNMQRNYQNDSDDYFDEDNARAQHAKQVIRVQRRSSLGGSFSATKQKQSSSHKTKRRGSMGLSNHSYQDRSVSGLDQQQTQEIAVVPRTRRRGSIGSTPSHDLGGGHGRHHHRHHHESSNNKGAGRPQPQRARSSMNLGGNSSSHHRRNSIPPGQGELDTGERQPRAQRRRSLGGIASDHASHVRQRSQRRESLNTAARGKEKYTSVNSSHSRSKTTRDTYGDNSKLANLDALTERLKAHGISTPTY